MNEIEISRAELLKANKNTPHFNFIGKKYEAIAVDVHDGDTARFAFKICKGAPIMQMSCRFLGYNSAEITSHVPAEKAKGLVSRDALRDKILRKIVCIEFGDFDKYGRPLVAVTDATGLNINKWMIEAGHGQVYFGTGEKKW